METSSCSSFPIIFSFLFLQTLGASSNTIMMKTSPNVSCIARERESLLLFKQSLTGNLTRLSTWRGVECCKWQGVECDRRNNGHVVTLDLRNPVSLDDWYLNHSNVVGGEISPSLLNLKHLRYLDLSVNNFTGQTIPDFFGSFKYLIYLNLSYSCFGGVVPTHLGNLSTLQYLDLNSFHTVQESLVVDDLWWVSSLSSLKHLDLSRVSIRHDVDWFHSVKMLPSLLTLNLASCDITGTIPSVSLVNFTSLNSLDLFDNQINSTIPFWLSKLTALMHLDLSYNNFHGQIPDFLGSFKHLKYLDISWSDFGGVVPPHLGNLTTLQYLGLHSVYSYHGPLVADDLQWVSSLSSLKHLDLSGVTIGDVNWFHSVNMLSSLLTLKLALCHITSTIPSVEFVNLTSLNSLDLHYNEINSTIPLWLSNLTDLMYLDLRDNSFHGQIPDFLGTLSNLVHLDVSSNSLVGVLSETHFTKLKNLTTLHLSSNPSLAFNFSSQWIPPFQLQQFDASSCNIGPRFPNWLQTHTNLHILELSNSSIRDTIPEWFENITFHISYLDLSLNQISGKLPPFQGGSNMKRHLLMNSNKFEGSLTLFPENVKVLDLSDNLLSGHVPQTAEKLNPSLEVVILSKNRFTGSIPQHFCKVLSINILDLSQNKFSGRLPQCLGNLNSLQVMDLSNNTITGDIPSSLGSLNLLSLHLGNNRLHGDLPVSLQNLTQLLTMDLGNNLLRGNIPFWIGEKLSDLYYLNLQLNEFTGKIPLQLCHLNTLRILNLGQNNLTGTISHCFGNLTGMIMNGIMYISYGGTYEENILASMKGRQLLYTRTIPFLTSLDLSSNNIIGEIPDALMNLVALKSLNLSRNMLKGHIPLIIGNLKKIESLDLSMNNLSGQIPQSLATLQYISYLNMSFNNLSGVIPIGNQIQTLNDPSIYEGNKGLCGPPLRSCTGNNSSFKHVDEDEGQDDTKDVWFCSGMGFVVGFVGLIGILYFNRAWRLAYYGILENVYDWLAVSLLLKLARVKRKFV